MLDPKRPFRRTGTRQRQHNIRQTDPTAQVLVGWGALALVLSATLANGAIAPAFWTLLCMASLVLFAVQALLDLRHGVAEVARRSLLAGGLYLAVVVWLLVQSVPMMPDAVHHPVWALAPEGAMPTISADPDSGRPVALRLTCYALLFWIFLRSAARGLQAVQYVQGIALFSTALAIYGIGTMILGANPLLGDYATAGRVVRASFVNQNPYANVAAFGVLANISAYYQQVHSEPQGQTEFPIRDYLERFFSRGWPYAFGALVGFSALAMTLSRAGAVGGLIGFGVLVWALFRGHQKPRRALLIISAVVVVFGAWWAQYGIMEKFLNTGQDARFRVFPYFIQGAMDRPFLGHGAGSFTDMFRAYVPLNAASEQWEYAHNTYLENAFEFGLPAYGLMLAALALIGLRLWRGVLTRRRYRSVPAFALACLATVAFHSVFDGSLQVPAIAALFAGILGIGWTQSFPARKPS